MSKRTGRTRALAIVISLLTLSLLAGCSPKPASQPTSAPTQETAQPTVAPSQQAQEPEAGKQPEDYTGTVLFWTWDDNYSNYMNPAFNEIYPNVAFQTAPVQAGDYLQKIQTSMASGLELPDVIYAESDSRIRTCSWVCAKTWRPNPITSTATTCSNTSGRAANMRATSSAWRCS